MTSAQLAAPTAGARGEPFEAAASAAPVGVVGPNAITQVAAALGALEGPQAAQRVFRAAGLEALLDAPPTKMVDQRLAAALHRALRGALGAVRAEAVAREAGRRTAEYLIANRIPRLVGAVLRLCPPRLAVALLLRAIGRNAWTFVGSGRFAAHVGRPAVVEIEDNPLAAGPCDWHAATFETLMRRLAAPTARVRETACAAAGAAACRFEIHY